MRVPGAGPTAAPSGSAPEERALGPPPAAAAPLTPPGPRASVSKRLVRAQVSMNIGKPLAIRLSSGSASVDWTGAVIEAARTKPVTLDEAREHIDRLGATPFEFSVLEVDLDEGVGIGFSALHKARKRIQIKRRRNF